MTDIIHHKCPDCGNEFDVDPCSTWVCECYLKPELRFSENQKTQNLVTGILNKDTRSNVYEAHF